MRKLILGAIVGVMSLVVISGGVVFAKATRVRPRVEFAPVAVVTEVEGRPTLMVRIRGGTQSSLPGAWVRLTLVRVDRLALAIAIGPGLVWQHEDADVLALDPSFGLPNAFRCAETEGPGLGLRAGLGAEIRLGGGFYFNLDGVVDALRLSSDPIGACAPGAGSTTLVGVRGGFSYRVDVSRYAR